MAAGNSQYNVRNYSRRDEGPLVDQVTIAHSLVDDPEWDGKTGNVSGSPLFDETFHLQEGSPGKGAADDGTDIGLL